MRATILPVFFLLGVIACHIVQAKPQPASTLSMTITPTATAFSLSWSDAEAPIPTSLISWQDNLELRQVAPADPNPAVPPVNPNPAAQPVAGSSVPVGGVSVTVMWIETWIGGTSQTWVPRTVTVNFAAVPHQGNKPGKGEIGMGTLTGETGHTKTVVVGAAATAGTRALRGVGVALGVGLAGIVV